jgi:type VI secretion system ImpM family protein
MPDEILTPPDEDDRRPVVGIFGKMPTTGDFVWRGLPDAFRKHWDFWLTRHIAPLRRAGAVFPPGGLRFSLPSGGRLAAGVIVLSHDTAGRHFPLSLLLIADGDLTQEQIDQWCDAALALGRGTLSPDELWISLDALPAPTPGEPATGPMQLWTPGGPPSVTDPTHPDGVLRALLQF